MEQSKKQECIELIKMIYRHSMTAGCLHIILDDGNVEDEHLDFCMNNALYESKTDLPGKTWFHLIEMACLMLLAEMDEAERNEVIDKSEVPE